MMEQEGKMVATGLIGPQEAPKAVAEQLEQGQVYVPSQLCGSGARVHQAA